MCTKCRVYAIPQRPFFITKLLTVLGRQGSSEIILSISQPVFSHTNSSTFHRTLFSAIDVLTSILWLFSNPEASGQECDFRR